MTSVLNANPHGEVLSPRRVVKRRDSNLELYRILCMILIVAHHFVVNSGLTSVDGPMSLAPHDIKTWYLWSFGMWGKTGINCFLMITGYFMCTSSITVSKFLRLILQIYFYKILIFIIFLIAGYEVLSLSRLVKLLMPIWGLNNNFTSCFVVFYLTIPFWNILIKNMTQRLHQLLLLLLLGGYTLLGSVPTFSVTFNYVTWFGIIYLIASYIRLYPHRLFENKTLWGWLTIGSIAVALFSMIFMLHMFGSLYAQFFVNDSNKIFAVLVAVCSFLWFKNIHLSYSKIINTIGASTFGVLLIHANSDAMRTWLWQDTVNCVGHYSLPLGELILYSVGVVIAIFALCNIIDILRTKFIERPFFKWYDRVESKMRNVVSSIVKIE